MQPDLETPTSLDTTRAAAVDHAIAMHGGDPRAAVAALIGTIEDLESEKAAAIALVSKGFARGRLPG